MREREPGSQYSFHGKIAGDLPSFHQAHLLSVPQLSIVLQAGNQASNMGFGGH